MLTIGIDRDWRTFYEGFSCHGYKVTPPPVCSLATPLNHAEDSAEIPEKFDLPTAALIFREDSFDPVSQVRRGRFYNLLEGLQPRGWEDFGEVRRIELCVFQSWPARIHLHREPPETLIALGTKSAMTLWRLVGIEHISTGEDLVTLRSRSNLGVLPELYQSKVPADDLNDVRHFIALLVEAAYRAGPSSVVDRAKDAAVAILGVYLECDGSNVREKDIAKLGNIAEKEELEVVANSARTLSRLHPRTKPNELRKRGLRSLTETDAEHALSCVGIIMREIGWAI